MEVGTHVVLMELDFEIGITIPTDKSHSVSLPSNLFGRNGIVESASAYRVNNKVIS
jgi:hypothetical protein